MADDVDEPMNRGNRVWSEAWQKKAWRQRMEELAELHRREIEHRSTSPEGNP